MGNAIAAKSGQRTCGASLIEYSARSAGLPTTVRSSPFARLNTSAPRAYTPTSDATFPPAVSVVTSVVPVNRAYVLSMRTRFGGAAGRTAKGSEYSAFGGAGGGDGA